MQPYLKEMGISIQLKKFIFSLKCRMLDIASNYPNKFPSKFCPLCRDEESLDTQEHLLSCPKLINSHQLIEDIPSYEDLFGENLKKQIKVACMIQENFKKRKEKLKKKDPSPEGEPSEPGTVLPC